MNQTIMALTAGDTRHAEIRALIETLHDTEQRLAALTAGEVDAVANQAGRTFLLQRAQEQLRHSEASKQAAILDALPARIVLLDAQGLIVSANAKWCRFADAHAANAPDHGVGRAYIEVGDCAAMDDAAQARHVRSGVQAVLAGHTPRFSIEYLTAGPSEQRWFLMTVTPLELGRLAGAIVMHLDITERTLAGQASRSTATLLHAIVAGTPDAVYAKDMQGRYLLCNEATARISGRTVDQMIGQEDVAIYGVEGARATLASDRRVRESGRAHTSESELNLHGRRRTFMAVKTPYRNEFGEMLGVIGISRDITELKCVEQDLRQRTAMLNMAGRLAHVGGWSVELPATRVAWTDALATLHDEPIGFSPSVDQTLNYYAPEHRDAMRTAFERCIGDGTPIDIEREIITARGRRVWVRVIGEAVRNDKGVILRVQGALQDLTERKHADLLTSRLAARLTNTLESITDGFFTVDREWRYTFVNGEAERVLKHTRADLLGRVVWEVFPEAVGTVFDNGYRRAMAGETGITFEALYEPWGLWIGVNCYPSEEGLSVSFRDVSGQRDARLRLELLEASVSQLNDIVLITAAAPLDAPGPPIVFANKAFEHVTGYTREEMLGKSPRLLGGPATDRTELDLIRAALERCEPVHAELVNYHKSGRPYWVEMDIMPVGIAGEAASHFVAVERDITERKRDQDALRELNANLEARVSARTEQLNLARDQAEQANRAKSSFLATMSHEIRTPMNGVIGMIDVLEQSNLRPGQLDTVKTIRESAYALLTIVDDVLDFSKIEAGQFQIDSEPMNVAAVVEAVCDTLDPLSQGKGVALRLFVDPNLPLRALGDAARLRQVLINLMGNAIKFSSGPGRSGRVHLRALARGQGEAAMLELVVSDNGIGMDALTVSRLFTPFTQADASTTRRFGGTGLGLSISLRLVELMNGRIEVKSEPGQGSTFSVFLPLAGLPSAPVATPVVLQGLCCLLFGHTHGHAHGLVDDLAAYLAHAGARVCRAVSQHDAQAFIEGLAAANCVVVMADPEEPIDPALAFLRALGGRRPALRLAFLVIEQGKRRKPRLRAADLVSVDGDDLHRDVFLRAVMLAAGAAMGDDPLDAAPVAETLPMPLDALDGRIAGRLILVAEDNEINQTVLRKQLALLGFAAEIAGNGQEALELLRHDDYALLLTDLHMPVMDGYELAATVRRAEAGERRMPIVALTANAVKGEARRCREVGMDDYMTKPVQLSALKAMLNQWLPAAMPAGGAAADDSAPAGAEDPAEDAGASPITVPADLAVLEALVGNDPVVIGDVLVLFGTISAQSAATIRQGVADGQMGSVVDAAHALKSNARSIGALQVGQTCAELERAAEAGLAQQLPVLLRRFEAEMEVLRQFLATHHPRALEPT